jgi:hypothetical protein
VACPTASKTSSDKPTHPLRTGSRKHDVRILVKRGHGLENESELSAGETVQVPNFFNHNTWLKIRHLNHIVILVIPGLSVRHSLDTPVSLRRRGTAALLATCGCTSMIMQFCSEATLCQRLIRLSANPSVPVNNSTEDWHTLSRYNTIRSIINAMRRIRMIRSLAVTIEYIIHRRRRSTL